MLKFMLVVILMAVAVYMLVRLIQRRGIMPPAQRKSAPGKSAPRPVGPDDDPDFLRDLDRKRRHPEDPDS